LRAAGLAPGKRVLVTGASGGVGHFAVQIAAHAGAHVIASVGSPGRGDDLTGAGAGEIVIGLDGIDEPLDIVLDSVGGPTLTGAWDLLAPGWQPPEASAGRRPSPPPSAPMPPSGLRSR
jgi:NADPH:quinone reductase-like Zn-dependent oxidoreductase